MIAVLGGLADVERDLIRTRTTAIERDQKLRDFEEKCKQQMADKSREQQNRLERLELLYKGPPTAVSENSSQAPAGFPISQPERRV